MESPAAARYAVAYGAAADAYARILDPTLEPVARRIVELAEVEAHESVLDLASGTGLVARAAAATGASVVGVDVSPGMVALARTLAAPETEFLVGDAAELPFANERFDVATCGFGFSHMPSIETVLAELRRVVRANGSLVEASWGSGGRNPAFGAVLEALGNESGGVLHAFEGILDEGTWADTERGAALLHAAGFLDVEVVTEPLRGSYASPQAAVDWTLAWPDYGETADRLREREATAFRAEAVEAVESIGDLSWEFSINYYVSRSSG
ncbi:MAG: class I SAM-dependent methyltransferase [Gaiellaceae bacterium]